MTIRVTLIFGGTFDTFDVDEKTFVDLRRVLFPEGVPPNLKPHPDAFALTNTEGEDCFIRAASIAALRVWKQPPTEPVPPRR